MDLRRLVGLGQESPDSTGLGPDFPGSAGDRERGKFRPSVQPRLTTVAVVSDSGQAIEKTTNEQLEEVIRQLTLLRHALVLGGIAEDIDDTIH